MLIAGLCAACGGTASWGGSDAPKKVLQAASSASMKRGSVHMTVHGFEAAGAKRVPIDGSAVTNLRNGNADMTAKVQSVGEVKTRIVDGTMYEKVPDDSLSPAAGMWIRFDLSGESSAAGNGNTGGAAVLNMLGTSSVDSVTRSGHAKINGRSTTEFDAVLKLGREPNLSLSDDASEFASFLEALELGTMPVKVYIDSEGLIRRTIMSASNLHGSLDLTIDYLKYGVPLHVTAPPADQVVPYSSVQEVLGHNTGN